MMINSSTTQLSFYPFVDFSEIYDTSVVIYHKTTKVSVTGSSAVSKTDSLVTISLPDLTDISNVATDGDEVLVRIFDLSGNLIWEYLGSWITGTSDLNKEWKGYTSTAPNTKRWRTI